MQGLGVDVSPSSLDGRIFPRLTAASEQLQWRWTLFGVRSVLKGALEKVESEGSESRLCRMSPLKPPPYVRFSAVPRGVVGGGGYL